MTNSLTSFGDIMKYAAMGETAYKDSAECPQQFLRAPKGEGRLPDLFYYLCICHKRQTTPKKRYTNDSLASQASLFRV